MAGPNLTYHEQIGSVESTSNSTPLTASIPEKLSQTFKIGTPVQLSGGFVQAWDGTTVAAGIAGFSLIPASNLASSGKGAPTPFGQIGPPGAIQTYGNVPYQASAVNIAEGTPITDGRTLFEQAVGNTIFEGQFDNSAGTVAADYTPTQASIGTQYGLTIDANGQWYVDAGKVTPGTNTVVTVVGINPIDGLIVNARVRFVVLASARQLPN